MSGFLRPARRLARRFGRVRIGLIGSLAAAPLLAGGCASSPPAERLPSLAEVRSNAPERADRIIPDAPAAAQGIASFQRIDLPLNVSIDEAWELVNEGAIPAVSRGVWNANGLRVGLLARTSVDEFVRKLPPAQGISRSQMLGSAHPLPMLRTPRLTGVATIDLTIPPGAVNEVEVTGGRLQLLARLVRDHRGALVLDLLPHHHVPKLTLEPRTALEKELDGRIFTELGLRVEVPRTHLLVVGLYRPWPKADDAVPSPPGAPPNPGDPGTPQGTVEQGGSASANALPPIPLRATEDGELLTPEQHAGDPTASPSGGPDVSDVTPPPLSNRLGRALFVTQRMSQPLQMILLAAVEPLGGGSPTYAPPPEPEDTE